MVLEHVKESLTNFADPRFVPARMTDMLQVVDRHIGIRYKVAVYMAVRKEMAGRLTAAIATNGGCAEGVTVPSLTPRELRILITHAIGNFHEKMSQSEAFERACVATGTWMPVRHCLEDNGPSNLPEDFQVDIQHLKEYKYAEHCSREKILQARDSQKEAKDAELAKLASKAMEESEAFEKAMLVSKPHQDKADSRMDQIQQLLCSRMEPALVSIASANGLDEFIVGGSYVSRELDVVVSSVFEDVEPTNLKANDCDVFHGTFAADGESEQLHTLAFHFLSY